MFWDKVHEVVGSTHECPGGTYWISDNSSFTAGAAHTSSFTFGLDNGKSLITGTPSQLANAMVAVAPGAVLRAEGDVTISALEIDVNNGVGTIDGFQFAANGVISIAGIDKLSNTFSVPVSFANVTGAENLPKWSLMVGGKRVNGLVTYANGIIEVMPFGAVVIIR